MEHTFNTLYPTYIIDAGSASANITLEVKKKK